MAGNSILTNSIITQEALMQLKNNLVLAKKINLSYSDQFASSPKAGGTVSIRKPSRYTVTDGATLEIQDSVDKYVDLSVNTQKHVGMAFSSKDRALSIDKFSDRYIKPAMVALANKVDQTLASAFYKKVYHSVGVPSASALPSTLKGFGQARAKIAKSGAPIDGLIALLDYDVEASMVNGLSGLFQASDELAKQYKKGSMGMASGMDFYASQNVPRHTIGTISGSTPLTDYPSTAYVAGSTSLVTNGWSSGATSLKAGDVITIDNVYEVNPQTRVSTGDLAQFVVQSDVSDTSGAITITLDRGMYASGQYQNVNALPANDAGIKVFGHATSYSGVICPQNLVFDKDFAALVMVDLPQVEGSVIKKDADAGISIRMVQDYDIVNDREITRLDVLFGYEVLYAELACRVVGQPA